MDLLVTQRRVLILAYRRYLAADRALQTARASARSWFPGEMTRMTEPIGNPGSQIRRLYERRDRAIARLALAREALEQAQARSRRAEPRKFSLLQLR